MNGNLALDTNTAIAALNGEVAVVNKLQDVIQVFLPLPVVGEILKCLVNPDYKLLVL